MPAPQEHPGRATAAFERGGQIIHFSPHTAGLDRDCLRDVHPYEPGFPVRNRGGAAPGAELTDALRGRINEVIRTEVSPRHVPDEILLAPAVPHTRTGKKLEVPINRLLQGADPARVVERSSVDEPALLDWYSGIRPPDRR